MHVDLELLLHYNDSFNFPGFPDIVEMMVLNLLWLKVEG